MEPMDREDFQAEWEGPWEVAYQGLFHRDGPQDEVCQPLPFSAAFSWLGKEWVVPGVYRCSQGLVVDVAFSVDPETVRAWTERYRLTEDSREEDYSPAEYIALERDNPLGGFYTVSLEVDGRPLEMEQGGGLCYLPWEPQGEPARFLRHYGLDQGLCWAIWRYTFPCGEDVKLDGFTVKLLPSPPPVVGEPFQVRPGERVRLENAAGEEVVLTAVAVERKELPDDVFKRIPRGVSQGTAFPRHYQRLVYCLTPEQEEGSFQLLDAARGEPVHAAWGFIDDDPLPGPAGASREGPAAHAACSQPRFAPVEAVAWLPVFQGLPRKPLSVPLEKHR